MEIEPYLEREKILQRVSELAEEIVPLGKKLITITILKGAKPFSEALRKALAELAIEVKDHEIKLSSYVGTQSSGEVKIHSGLPDVEGENILIIEDMVDTGNTLAFFREQLLKEGVKSVKICALLDKTSRREKEIAPDYIGFTIPNKFLVGFGLDYEEKYRELPYIGELRL
jgi:hypoxanthine phosphoribosyltransferase